MKNFFVKQINKVEDLAESDYILQLEDIQKRVCRACLQGLLSIQEFIELVIYNAQTRISLDNFYQLKNN